MFLLAAASAAAASAAAARKIFLSTFFFPKSPTFSQNRPLFPKIAHFFPKIAHFFPKIAPFFPKIATQKKKSLVRREDKAKYKKAGCRPVFVTLEKLSREKILSNLEQQADDSSGEEVDSESEEDDKNNHAIVVPGCGKPKFDAKKKPYYAKKNYCFVCQKSISRLDKHLPRIHNDDANVNRIFSMDEGRQKKQQLQLLINRGNFIHNIAVLKKKSGELVVKRRRKKDTKNYKGYTPCPKCLGYYDRPNLFRHECMDDDYQERKPLTLSKAFLFFSLSGNNGNPTKKRLTEILANPKKKILADIISEDTILMEYGCWIINKHKYNKDQTQYIWNKLSDLARVIKYLQDSKEQSFKWKDLLKPKEFHFLVEEVKKMEEGPSLLRFGQCLSELLTVYKGLLFASQANRKILREAYEYEHMITSMMEGKTLPEPEELANVHY